VTIVFEAFGRNHSGLKDVVGFCSHEKRWSRFLAAAEITWVVQRSCVDWMVLGWGGARLCL